MEEGYWGPLTRAWSHVPALLCPRTFPVRWLKHQSLESSNLTNLRWQRLYNVIREPKAVFRVDRKRESSQQRCPSILSLLNGIPVSAWLIPSVSFHFISFAILVFGFLDFNPKRAQSLCRCRSRLKFGGEARFRGIFPCLPRTYRTRHCHDVHKRICEWDLGKVSFIRTSKAHDVFYKQTTNYIQLHLGTNRGERESYIHRRAGTGRKEMWMMNQL